MTVIDVSEDKLHREDPRVLELLLRDQTTKRNIVWATSSYEYLGKGFASYQAMGKSKVTGIYKDLIQPRSAKHATEQKSRTKSHAEVFTPTWIVDKQVTIAHDSLKDLSFEDYIDSKWLEITCGEAPYIVTPYDTVTGEPLALAERVGFLDRKMQRIIQEVDQLEDWLHWVVRAYQATYGYEYQGDSLLLARENLYTTFLDYYQEQFGQAPDEEMKTNIARIISYNVFQMDGLAYTTPHSEAQKEHVQLSLFEDYLEEDETNQAQKTQIKDWKKKKTIGFERLSSGEEDMKFDVVIGNPPYQDNTIGDNESYAPPVYHHFLDESAKIGKKSLLITPGRFLFNAGGTPKSWNKKMLLSNHLKIVYYEQTSAKVFSGTDIKGGVAISYQDCEEEFEPIDTFTPYKELNEILHLVSKKQMPTLDKIVSGRGIYKLSNTALEEFPEIESLQSKGHKYDVGSGAFRVLKDIIFYEEKQNDEQISFLGLSNLKRTYYYADEKYFNLPPHFYQYKIFIPKSNGSGAIGEVLSTPLIGEPLIGATETFLSIGGFDIAEEAEACLKYIKTKFARAMLGILKITQDNTKDKWSKVPLFNFNEQDNIDWTESISEIDKQLYRYFDLKPEHITFIETKVKEME